MHTVGRSIGTAKISNASFCFVILYNYEVWYWQQGCGSGSGYFFCGSGSTLMKEVGSELGGKSVEKELEAEAIFLKSGASGFSNWLQPLG